MADPIDPVKTFIKDALVKHLMRQAPSANPRPMYGGTVFELETDNPKSRVGGVYIYEHHVSLELAEGASFADTYGVLEGTGKHRKHIKLRQLSDVEDKHCFHYLDVAIAKYNR